MQLKLGWTEAAMIAGARGAGVSPAIVGSFPRKEGALVEVYLYMFLPYIVLVFISRLVPFHIYFGYVDVLFVC